MHHQVASALGIERRAVGERELPLCERREEDRRSGPALLDGRILRFGFRGLEAQAARRAHRGPASGTSQQPPLEGDRQEKPD